MSLSGDLGDLSVVDVLQFIHLGGRSGTLVLRRGEDRGEVAFHRGRIVGAHGPSTHRLGDSLLEGGEIDARQLAEAVERQRKETPRRSLGQILVAMGAISVETLRKHIERQIEHTIYDLVSWKKGRFEFELDELRVHDEIAVDPAELILQVDINTQMLLLEAMRIFDERNAKGASAGATLAAATQVAGATVAAGAMAPMVEVATARVTGGLCRRRLQVVTSDRDLVQRLTALLPAPENQVVRVALREAGSPPPGEEPPAVLVDLRHPSVAVDAIEHLRRTRPRALVIALAGSATSLRLAYESGAFAVVPPDEHAVVAAFNSGVKQRQDLSNDGAIAAGVRAGFAKLRSVFADLRTGLVTATVSLNLMNIISDQVERAVLFLVKRDGLLALGAFGQGQDGQGLAEATRNLTLPLGEAGLLAQTVREGHARSSDFEGALPARLERILGRPKTGQVVAFPVMGAERVIAIIYTDNGRSARAIEQIEILELAAAHVGVSFENELLRRRIREVGGGGPVAGAAR